MTSCEKIRIHLTSLALEELDVELRREVEGHVGGCSPCAAALESIRRASLALRALPPVEPSQERRDRAVAALQAEHARRVEGIVLRRRPRIRVRAAAAALLAALGAGGFLLWSSPAPRTELEVVERNGRVRVLRHGETRYAELEPRALVVDGDRVVTEPGAVVRFRLREEGSPAGRVEAGSDTAFALAATPQREGRRILLERGLLQVDLGSSRAETWVQTPYEEDRMVAHSGAFEVRLRETVRLVAAWKESKPEPVEGADLVFADAPLRDVCRELSLRTGAVLEPLSPDVAEKRVTFYGRSADPDLLAGFRAAMKQQGMALHESGSRILLLPSRYEGRESARRMLVRVNAGEARLIGTRGEVLLTAGQDGVVDFLGMPSVRPSEGGLSPLTEGPRVRLPELRLISSGRDAEGRPVLECVMERGEASAEMEGGRVVVTVSPGPARLVSPGPGGEAEMELKLTFRFEKP